MTMPAHSSKRTADAQRRRALGYVGRMSQAGLAQIGHYLGISKSGAYRILIHPWFARASYSNYKLSDAGLHAYRTKEHEKPPEGGKPRGPKPRGPNGTKLPKKRYPPKPPEERRPAPEVYEPTPDEIAAACAQIQATWSLQDEQLRRGGGCSKERPGRPPVRDPRR